ncbi:unnamed protein product [Dracunculus medinensis]|uniref:EGF-like domain-containing protein n=1 Tax=Dracunculus medinensis TaxID=318479 RepID=A0A158Q562_DRAME|nr:unnamed protein product [Dracunculus medinensis]
MEDILHKQFTAQLFLCTDKNVVGKISYFGRFERFLKNFLLKYHKQWVFGFFASGPLCENRQPNVCDGKPCGVNGECKLTRSVNDYRCECSRGFTEYWFTVLDQKGPQGPQCLFKPGLYGPIIGSLKATVDGRPGMNTSFMFLPSPHGFLKKTFIIAHFCHIRNTCGEYFVEKGRIHKNSANLVSVTK